MITRAQAEALLTLAESLEACERTGISVFEDFDGLLVSSANSDSPIYSDPEGHLTGMSIRLAVATLSPKRSGRLTDP